MRGSFKNALLESALALATLGAALMPLRSAEPLKLDRSALQTGPYSATVHQTATAKTDGTTVEDDLPFALLVQRIDSDGRVQARVTVGRHSGDVTGTIDPENRLHLEGTLTHSALPGKWEFKMDAIANEDKLVDGVYTKVSERISSRGTFSKARLEK